MGKGERKVRIHEMKLVYGAEKFVWRIQVLKQGNRLERRRERKEGRSESGKRG